MAMALWQDSARDSRSTIRTSSIPFQAWPAAPVYRPAEPVPWPVDWDAIRRHGNSPLGSSTAPRS